MDFKDKVVIVTGASSGIGEAVARLFSQKDAKVVLVARSQDKLNILQKELPNSFVVVADMRKQDDIKKMVQDTIKHFGRVDILINNAGRGYDSMVEKIDPEKYTELFQLNLLGPVIAMQEVIPFMRQQGSGYIVNVSSGTALMNIPNLAAYSSLKKALAGISLTAREELKNDGIGVSVSYPYMTISNFGKNVMGQPRDEMPPSGNLAKPDTSEYVAEKLVEGIEKNEAEIFVHDWMKK